MSDSKTNGEQTATDGAGAARQGTAQAAQDAKDAKTAKAKAKAGDAKGAEPPAGAGPAAESKGAAPPRGDVRLGKYVTIHGDKRLEPFDRPSAQAFAATDSRTPNQAVYALVCASGRPPRLDALGPINKVRTVPLVTPVDWGPVDWTPMGREGAGERRYALVFEQPVEPPLVPRFDAALTPLREEQIIERVLRPLVKVLSEIEGRGLTHRGISVDNLFGADGGSGAMMLGECVSAPAGMLQPSVYETIDAAQALPAGRGHGSQADDLYALGVLMAVLVRGGDPTAGLDPREVVARKIERGSYATLLERARVSLKLMEPLRGLLCDRVDERWDLPQLEHWLNGKYQSPKQPSLPQKARRGFTFAGKEYWTCPGLAHGLASNWQEALRVIADGELAQWAARSLGDDKHAKLIQATLAAAHAEEGGGDDRALARTLVALDPSAPLRVREFATRLDALPQLLAIEYDNADRRNAFVQTLRAKLPQRWLEAQPSQRGDHPQVLQRFERMAWFADREQIGYGLERVLYEFNDGWPCQSELIAASYVSDVADILPALERRAEQEIPDQPPIDRHIAAFCGANMSPPPDRVLQGLGKASAEHRAHAMLSLLAELQRRYGPQKLPVLAEGTARHIGPLSDALQNRDLRDKVERRIKRAVQAGSLIELRAAIADRELRRQDAEGFARAKRLYAQAAREIAWLEDGGLTNDTHIAWATRGTAAAISAIGSGLMVVLLTVFYVS